MGQSFGRNRAIPLAGFGWPARTRTPDAKDTDRRLSLSAHTRLVTALLFPDRLLLLLADCHFIQIISYAAWTVVVFYCTFAARLTAKYA